MSEGELKVYDAGQVKLSVFDRNIDSGFSEGDFVEVQYTTKQYTSKVGADGEVTRVRSLDRRATAKITLMQTSLGNNIFSQLLNAGLLDPNGNDVGTFQVTDLSGTSLAHADKCWVQGFPVFKRGAEPGTVEWTLEMASLDMQIEGNPSV